MAGDPPGMGAIGIGLRAHLGWAAAVALEIEPQRAPAAFERRRIELTDPAVAESHEPYHAAWRAGGGAEAEAHVRRGRRAIETTARRTLRAWLDELRGRDRVVAAGILTARAAAPASLEAAIASHQRVHVAEGALFRDALAAACEAGGLRVRRVVERDVWGVGAAELGLAEDELRRRVDDWKRELGAPWAQDQKLAALAAWIALAGRSERPASRRRARPE
jgi:hypothetical protein